MALTKKERALIGHRFTLLLREVGTLLVAFAPLDYFQHDAIDVPGLAGFTILGLALFAWSVFRDLRGDR